MLSLHTGSRQPIRTVVFRNWGNNTSRQAFSRPTQRQAGPPVPRDSPVTVPVVCQTRGLGAPWLSGGDRSFSSHFYQRYSAQLRPVRPIIIDDLISLFAFTLNRPVCPGVRCESKNPIE